MECVTSEILPLLFESPGNVTYLHSDQRLLVQRDRCGFSRLKQHLGSCPRPPGAWEWLSCPRPPCCRQTTRLNAERRRKQPLSRQTTEHACLVIKIALREFSGIMSLSFSHFHSSAEAAWGWRGGAVEGDWKQAKAKYPRCECWEDCRRVSPPAGSLPPSPRGL